MKVYDEANAGKKRNPMAEATKEDNPNLEEGLKKEEDLVGG